MARPEQQAGVGRRTHSLRALLPWLALFGAAGLVRSLRFGLVFGPGEVRFPFGADELYHLRRVWFTIVNFPHSLDFDPYLNHPMGAPPIWPPAFDWSIAALARALVGPDDQHAVEVVAAWVPPVIGACTVLATVWLIRRAFSPAAGWVAGALLAVLPAHVYHSALGNVDHHVAVALLATLLVGVAMRLAGPVAADGRPRGALATGIVVAAAIALWPGALLHVLVVQAFLVVQLLATREVSAARARARALAGMHAVAALGVLPFCVGRAWPQLGPFSPEALSGFQPLWLASGAAALALGRRLWARAAFGATRGRRLATALAVGALGATAAWITLPGLADGVRAASGWFGVDPFLGVVAELRPLLFETGRFDAAAGPRQFSHLFWLYPIALAVLVGQALRGGRSDLLLLLSASAAFCAAALYQRRFTDVACVGFVWVMGPAIVAAFRAGTRRFRPPRLVQIAAALPVAVAALLPHATERWTEWAQSRAALGGVRIEYAGEAALRDELRQLARWMKRNTPKTRGYLEPGARPEYGVLGAWGHGHLLRYYAERPMVQDNFGPWAGRNGFDAARHYYDSRDENEAAAIADRLEVRYVVATTRGSGQRRPEPESMAWRLVPARLPDGGFAVSGSPLAPLARHRLLQLAGSTGRSDPTRRAPPPVALYEIVAGALVRGRAPDEAAVQFQLSFRLPEGALLRYTAQAPVDASGRYQIRLPYPSEEGYLVRSGGRRGRLPVSESDVRQGRTLAGPELRDATEAARP